MRLNSKIIGGMAIVALITVLELLLPRSPRHADNPTIAEPDSLPAVPARSAQDGRTLFAPAPPSTAGHSSDDAPVPSTADATAAWEKQLNDVLRDDSEPDGDVKAEKLLALFPTLPEAGQVEVAKHIVNLTSDERYSGIGQYVTNTALSEDAMEELFADLLNRPNSVKLPKLLEIATNPQHQDAGEAKDALELYLEEDHGDDWRKWEQTLYAWLKDNPD